MHKESCTVSFVMSGRSFNMSHNIYNGGLLSTYNTLSSLAPQSRDPKVKGRLQKESCDVRQQNKTTVRDVVVPASIGVVCFIYALLGCNGDPKVTFRAKKRGEGRDVNYPW